VEATRCSEVALRGETGGPPPGGACRDGRRLAGRAAMGRRRLAAATGGACHDGAAATGGGGEWWARLARRPGSLVVLAGMARERLDKLLVDRGLVASRERARALVMTGAVLVRGQPETKPGTMVDVAHEITLRAEDHPYVSRGALKLVRGLEAFGIDPAGAVALDIGASTGGFSDVLLRRGAARIYAIDVGYGQLAWSIRQDPRVVVLERENVRHIDLARVPEPCDLAVIDVSFISLTQVLPRVIDLLRPPPGKPIVALVKPQFEVGRDLVGKGGVVRDPDARRGAIDKVRAWAAANGLVAGDVVESPITGPAGNVEYLLLLRTAGAPSAPPASSEPPASPLSR